MGGPSGETSNIDIPARHSNPQGMGNVGTSAQQQTQQPSQPPSPTAGNMNDQMMGHDGLSVPQPSFVRRALDSATENRDTAAELANTAANALQNAGTNMLTGAGNATLNLSQGFQSSANDIANSIINSDIAQGAINFIQDINEDARNFDPLNTDASVALGFHPVYNPDGSHFFSAYNGFPVIHISSMGNSGMFLGAIFLGPGAGEDLLNHEAGHGKEVDILGYPTWLVAYAIPSLANFLGQSHFGDDWLFLTAPPPHARYNHQRHEVNASRLGGLIGGDSSFNATAQAQLNAIEYFDRILSISQLSGIEHTIALAGLGFENLSISWTQILIATGNYSPSTDDCPQQGSWSPNQHLQPSYNAAP